MHKLVYKKAKTLRHDCDSRRPSVACNFETHPLKWVGHEPKKEPMMAHAQLLQNAASPCQVRHAATIPQKNVFTYWVAGTNLIPPSATSILLTSEGKKKKHALS